MFLHLQNNCKDTFWDAIEDICQVTLSEEFKSFVWKLIEFDPKKRLSAEEALIEIQKFGEGCSDEEFQDFMWEQVFQYKRESDKEQRQKKQDNNVQTLLPSNLPVAWSKDPINTLDIKSGHSIGEGEKAWTVLKKVESRANPKLYLVHNGKNGTDYQEKVIELGLIGEENLKVTNNGK